jgi:ATP-dependent Clp protease protease subunit
MLKNSVKNLLFMGLGLFSLFPLITYGAQDEEQVKNPVPLAAQGEQTILVEPNQIPKAAQEPATMPTLPPLVAQPPELPKALVDENNQELATEVKRLQLEQTKLRLEHEQELLKFQLEKEKLLLENDLHQAKETQLLAQLNALKTRLELENALREQQQQKMLAAVQAEQQKLAAENELQAERNRQEELKIQFEMSQLEFQRTQLNLEIEELDRQLTARTKTEEWDSQVNQPQEYLQEPFVDGRLIISDRKIVLEEPIWEGTANYIIERLQYYNNKSTEYPIFLVIDYCPGGSVMEGTRIVNAMKTSRAPVYVVVKSFAASMAAVITALAERSYALPDAIIIHHQVWGLSFGNRTEQREQLKILDEWTQRIMQPVADKMEISLDEFIRKMYEQNSLGDWFEFADAALNYGWVDFIIEDIQDHSYTKQPVVEEQQGYEVARIARQEKVDDSGKRYIKVPRLRPMDVYHLHNPDNYYRY